MPSSEKYKDFHQALLSWYDIHRRILPWREDPKPYHIWLSEVMLQQTRVEAVKSYYNRFLSILPDIAALAAADEDRYMKLWEGLGYYSRVRNLHKGALYVTEHFGGELPASFALLQQIPGIGPYTAAAIASIAFQKKVPAVDGNLLRIFARLQMYAEDIKAPAAKKEAFSFYLDRMPDMRTGDFNQALMDVGALLCLPKGKALCSLCPLSPFCLSHARGKEQDFPYIPPKAKRKTEYKTVLLIHDRDKIALRKRPDKGLLASLYEFPNMEGLKSRDEVLDFLKSLGIQALKIKTLPESRHIFTHKEWCMQGFEIFTDELQEMSIPAKQKAFLYMDLRDMQERCAIPSAFAVYRKYLENPEKGL